MPRPRSREQRKERLEARVTGRQKALLQRAAAIKGCTPSQLVVEAASDAAPRVIETDRFIRLTAEHQAVVVKALLNPPEPSPRPRAAVKRYRKLMQP
ncbi:DUF1778 domain-containing protein [bacterium]|nr:DUF1778 domain-containing protein [bacterium]